MKDRREYIIRKSMELYALNGYQNVSITDLQIALDMGRGTLYYYFKDQDELFLTCMETYFLIPKHRVLQSIPETVGIADMIEAMMRYLGTLEEALMSFDNKSINTSNVNGLMFSACSKFPSFSRRAKRLAIKEQDLWRKAILNDQRTGRARRGIDVEQIALIFAHVKNSYDSALGMGQMNFQLLRKTYTELHKLIKNE